MRLGILLSTSPEHHNSTTALRVGRAALERGMIRYLVDFVDFCEEFRVQEPC